MATYIIALAIAYFGDLAINVPHHPLMGSDERLKIFMAQMRLLLLVPIGNYGSGYRLQSEGVAPVTLCTFLCSFLFRYW